MATDAGSIIVSEGGHAVLGAFVVWALAMVRRILAKTLVIDARMDRLDLQSASGDLALGDRIDQLSERLDRVVARLAAMADADESEQPGV